MDHIFHLGNNVAYLTLIIEYLEQRLHEQNTEMHFVHCDTFSFSTFYGAPSHLFYTLYQSIIFVQTFYLAIKKKYFRNRVLCLQEIICAKKDSILNEEILHKECCSVK